MALLFVRMYVPETRGLSLGEITDLFVLRERSSSPIIVHSSSDSSQPDSIQHEEEEVAVEE